MKTDLEESTLLARRREIGAKIYPFLREIVVQGRKQPYTFDRQKLLELADAFRSREFMRTIEDDPDLSYDLKIQISNMVTGINKGWPLIRRVVFSDVSDEMASVAVAIVDHLVRILEALGVQAVPIQEGEIQDQETDADRPPDSGD